MKVLVIGLICIVWVQKASSAPKWSNLTPGHSDDDHGLADMDNDFADVEFPHGGINKRPEDDETGPLDDILNTELDYGEDLCPEIDGNGTVLDDDDYGYPGPRPSMDANDCPSWMETANRIIIVAGWASLVRALYMIFKKQGKLARKSLGKFGKPDGKIGLPVSCQPPTGTDEPAEDDIQLPHLGLLHGPTDASQFISMKPLDLEIKPQKTASVTGSVGNPESRSSPAEDTADSQQFPSLDHLAFDSSFGVFTSESEEFPDFPEVGEFEQLDFDSFSWESMEKNAEESKPSEMFLYSDLVIKEASKLQAIPVLDNDKKSKSSPSSGSQVYSPSVPELLLCPFSEPLDWNEISRQMKADNDTADDPELVTIFNSMMKDMKEDSPHPTPKFSTSPDFKDNFDPENKLASDLNFDKTSDTKSKSSPNSGSQVFSQSPYEPEYLSGLPLDWNEISRQMKAENGTADDPELVSIFNRMMEDLYEDTPLPTPEFGPSPDFEDYSDPENQLPWHSTPELKMTDKTKSYSPSDTGKSRHPDNLRIIKNQPRSSRPRGQRDTPYPRSSSRVQRGSGDTPFPIDHLDFEDDLMGLESPGIKVQKTKEMDVSSNGRLNWKPSVENDLCIPAQEILQNQMPLEAQTEVIGEQASDAKRVSFSEAVTVKTIFLRRSYPFLPKFFRKKVEIRTIEDVYPLKGDAEEKPFKQLKRSKKILSLLRF